MRKKILLILALFFLLLFVVFVVPGLLNRRESSPAPSPGEIATEVMVESAFPKTETQSGSEAPTGPDGKPLIRPIVPRPHPGGPGEVPETPGETEYQPGEPVERVKTPATILFASDVHYMSPDLTDYGRAFKELTDNSDGRVVRYLPQIWQAFQEEVIREHPDALILCGDLTLNGERQNHEEFASLLSGLETAGIRVLVIPGNHDINNRFATSYFGGEQSPVEGVTAEQFRRIYAPFGYDEAASAAPDSLSYLYALNDTTWMMMLDTCIYEPENRVSGRISDATLEWMEARLREAYEQGVTVIPVGHHNLQELSRVYVEECVIENHDETLRLFEKYLTPVYFSGHLHVQRILKHTSGPGVPENEYGITEIVSNSLVIPPCQYGLLSCGTDGAMRYHTKNVDMQAWAAKRGETNPDLLDFSAFSDAYLRSIVSWRTFKRIEDIPDYMREEMADFYADLYQDYYAGRPIDQKARRLEEGYRLWERFMDPPVQFRQVEGMLKDSLKSNNEADIPNPIGQTRGDVRAGGQGAAGPQKQPE